VRSVSLWQMKQTGGKHGKGIQNLRRILSVLPVGTQRLQLPAAAFCGKPAGAGCILGYILATQKWALLLLLPVIGYGFAWIGHFVFEKNRPATFTYPLFSFMGDWVMFKDMLTGKVKF